MEPASLYWNVECEPAPLGQITFVLLALLPCAVLPTAPSLLFQQQLRSAITAASFASSAAPSHHSVVSAALQLAGALASPGCWLSESEGESENPIKQPPPYPSAPVTAQTPTQERQQTVAAVDSRWATGVGQQSQATESVMRATNH